MSVMIINPFIMGGAIPWTPSLITTEGWYDASDAATITAPDGPVSQWDDKSGKSRHLVQGNPTLRLVSGSRLLNGLNVLDGDGTQWIGLNPFPVNADGNVSIFGVHVVDLVNHLSDAVYAMDSAGADFKFSCSNSYSGPDFRGFIQGAWGTSFALTDFPHNGPSIYHVEFDKTGSGLVTARIDGISRGSATYVTNLTTSMNFTILADKAAVNIIDGAVGEVIVVHDDLSVATRQKIEGYMAWKWNLVSNLDAEHPYKSQPPYA